MKQWLSKRFPRLFPRRWRTKRAEFRCVPYCDADALLATGWELALPEEDENQWPGMVYLERRVAL